MASREEPASGGGAFRSLTGQAESEEPVPNNSNGASTITATSSTHDSAPAANNNNKLPQSPGVTPPALSPAVASDPARAPNSHSHRSSNNATPTSATSQSQSIHLSSPSNLASPRSSREASPTRLPSRQQSNSGVVRALRSRKNSHDLSPSRPPSITGATVPSAAAIQRALSAASTPHLPSISTADQSSKIPRPQRSGAGTSGDNTPHWPLSPKLKSPPPSTSSRRNSLLAQRKPETTASAPSIVVQRSTPASSTPTSAGKGDGSNSESDDTPLMNMKVPSRGASGAMSTLETVQEASLPTTPALGVDSGNPQSPVAGRYFGRPPDERRPRNPTETISENLQPAKVTESGSESGGNRSDGKSRRQSRGTDTDTTPRPKVVSAKSSRTPLVPTKTKSGPESTSRNMTVETETVSSIPQPAIGGAPSDRGRSDPSGSLRLKPSTETIRPKKDRKKTTRKAPSINSGTASSKADIFEAKVASAVDEANSSDSDETFVYESNPPDPQPRRSRQHSRTPSTTSMASIADHRSTIRSNNQHDTQRGVAVKRSMKFANNPYNDTNPNNPRDRQDGTIRASHSGGGSSIHHHHIGRHGRPGPGHASLFDHDSPFSPGTKSRSLTANTSLQSSKPSSPRFPNHSPRTGNEGNKNGEYSIYDMDGEGTADDERTPLVGTVRTSRSRAGAAARRPNSASLRQLDYYEQRRRRRGWLSRVAGCIVLLLVMAVVVFGAVAVLFALTKPLYGVSIREIQNVLASEQEIMLDLCVGAVNPNIVAVTVADMDVNVFAKSRHVGTDRWWREHGGGRGGGGDAAAAADVAAAAAAARPIPRRKRYPGSSVPSHPPSDDPLRALPAPHPLDDDDDPHDRPTDNPSNDAQTMLLGRILHFDSALVFDGSPLHRHAHHSVGEVRLPKPGNKTEAGGTERWERVIQHPFELIVRGILRYQLPLSARVHAAPIQASVVVRPGEGEEEGEGGGLMGWVG